MPSPKPWWKEGGSLGMPDLYRLRDAEGKLVATWLFGDDADEILRAVNSNEAPAAAMEKVLQIRPRSMLEDCAYQGPPPKKRLKEMEPYYRGYNEALETIKEKLRAALALAKEETP